MSTVFCVGEALIDFVAKKQDSNLSEVLTFTKNPGGAPANVACAIAKLGGKSTFIGCVGDDPFGAFLLKVLKDNNVDTSLTQASKTFTTLAFVSLAENGERDFVFSRGADKKLVYEPVVKKDFKDNMLHLGAATAFLGGGLEEAYGRYFFDALTQNTFISFDPNFRSDLWRDDEDIFIKKCMPFIQKSHLCKFSIEEAQLLSGKQDLNEACAILHEIGAEIIAITRGCEGTLISTSEKTHTIESITVKPIDTTGAGDAFIGCLLQQIAALQRPHNILTDTDLLIKMVTNANKAGAISTTSYGAIPSLPTKEMVY